MNRSARSAGLVLACLALLVGWYCVASNYDYGALAGTYTFKSAEVKSTLTLKADRTFQQELYSNGTVVHATGNWHRIGEGGVDFSIGFLRIPGAKPFREEFPDHLDGTTADDQYYGHFEKVMGIYPELKLNANPPGPTYYRRFLP